MPDIPPPNPPRAWAAVIALGVAVFVVTVTEMMPIGLIPQMATDLRVSEGAAGLSVTMYGVVAGLSAPVVTSWTRRLDRRVLVLAVLGAFVVGNVATAMVPDYPQLLVVRLAMGLCHGLMWSITASTAVRLVAPASATTATAVAFSGISLALVVGVPAGTFLGAWVGWRAAFMSVAALTALAWIAVIALVPALPQIPRGRAHPWRELLSRPTGVRQVLVVTALAVMGTYAAYTYIAPFLIHRLGVPTAGVGVYLLVYGAAGVIGNFAAGALLARVRTAGTVLSGALAVATASLTLLTVGSGLGAWTAGGVIALWGMSYSALPVILQTMILRRAPHAREAATAIYVLVFNVSIALGALGGAVAIDRVSTSAPLALGAVLGVMATVATRMLRDRDRDVHVSGRVDIPGASS